MKNLEARLESVHAFSRERIKLASERMKTRYDSRATDHHFKERDLVWMYNPKRRRGLSPKLQQNWEGPYTVVKKLNDVVYSLFSFTTVKGTTNKKECYLDISKDRSLPVQRGHLFRLAGGDMSGHCVQTLHRKKKLWDAKISLEKNSSLSLSYTYRNTGGPLAIGQAENLASPPLPLKCLIRPWSRILYPVESGLESQILQLENQNKE
ncbi:hypothetical protein AVEN_261059-1 [Araneus ventricosus]|uniref:Uncharacterized protein n=1 Tax=Araneus ventricosus TaxID=182803 RepID=A0A4Y2G474_ARAVE|nr:hypothetical protein AVEN_261059-1 [Araneus ventricosus]